MRWVRCVAAAGAALAVGGEPSSAVSLQQSRGASGIPKRIIVTSPYDVGTPGAQKVIDRMGAGVLSLNKEKSSISAQQLVERRFAEWAPKGTQILYFDNYMMHKSVVEISERLAAQGIVNDTFAAYQNLRPMAYKADLWRYMMLWDQGGIYVDADITLKAPLTRWIDFDKDELVLIQDAVETKAPSYWQAMMAARPRSDLLVAVLRGVVDNVLQTPHFYGQSPLDITGPTAMYEKLHEIDEVDTRVRLEYRYVHARCEDIDWEDCKARVQPLSRPDRNFAQGLDQDIAEEKLDDVFSNANRTHYSTLWKKRVVYCDESWQRRDLDVPKLPAETCPFTFKGSRNLHRVQK